MVFCLMEGPNKEACHKTHEESHGMTACNIIEVSDDEYNIFMARGSTQKDDLAYMADGNLDTVFRTIMQVNTSDFSGKYQHYIIETKRLIKKFHGKIVRQPNDDETMASFLLASDAIIAAMAIANLLQTVPDNFEYRLALVSGIPVDEKGIDLFEVTKKRVRTLCQIGLNNVVYLDANTKALSQKESNTPKVNHAHVKIVDAADFSFCEEVNKLPRCKHTRYLEEESYFNENHPFSNFPPKYEASLGELNPIEIKVQAQVSSSSSSVKFKRCWVRGCSCLPLPLLPPLP